MPAREYALYRFVIGVVIVAVIVAFGAIQLASDAFASRAAVDGTLPTRVPASYALLVYRLLDRVAPAPYVDVTLAEAALANGDADAAERYAVRLPAAPVRDDLLARVAAARGESALAQEYFLAAPDPSAVQRAVEALASRDPAAAYELEARLETLLARNGTHPDATAQADWELGRLANRQAWRKIPGSASQRTWLRRALRDFDAAVRLAPLSGRYLLEAANQADLLGDRARAEELFKRSVEVDPSSADAIAGLGVIAFQSGDRRTAADYLARARALDPNALMVRALERDLR